jgi:ectoine hydroxylase-related dioxygenase (phytanoyl-CoA dioxygenase family)
MSFVNGSHRAGVLGDYTTYGGGDALDAFPELHELKMSEPMNYELGDITVHTHLTVHGAGPNLMDQPRWAYILVTQPSDVCWNGSPCPNFDSTSMKPWEPLGDERFPVIS